MIIRCRSGGQVVIGEMPWVRAGGAAYLAVGNAKASCGILIDPAALDRTIEELTRIRAEIAKRAAAKQQRRPRKAA